MIGSAVAAIVVLVWLVGRWYRRSIVGDIDRRFARSADGVIRGAEPIRHDGNNGAAVLLVHGGGDTPQTLRNLADALTARGYSVVAPLLPGHGRSLSAFDSSPGEAWYDCVSREFSDLRESHDWVGVIGLSMGGALSARLAADTHRVDALVLASPYLSMPAAGSLLARTSAVWGILFPAIRTASDRSVLDPSARATSLGYGAFTHRSLAALRATAARGYAALPRIDAPTLVIQSRTDNRISSAATERAFQRIGAAEKKLEWVEGAGHVITVDYGWRRVVDRMVEWMDTHRAVPKKTGRPADAPVTPHA